MLIVKFDQTFHSSCTKKPVSQKRKLRTFVSIRFVGFTPGS
jgi:hypothetical protein